MGFLHVYMWVHMCLQVHIHVCARACWGKKLALGDSLHLSHTCRWRQSVSVNLQLAGSLKLHGQLALETSVSCSWTLWLQVGLQACGPCVSERTRPPGFIGSHFTLCATTAYPANIPFPFEDLFLFMCQDVSEYFCHVYESTCGGQKRPSDLQELELHMVVSHPV